MPNTAILIWICLALGVIGNVLIFLAFRSYPRSASKFMFQLLAVFDLVSLALLASHLPLVWSDVLKIDNQTTTMAWTIYLNVSFYIAIFTNFILIFVALERLLYVRFPSSHSQYFHPLARVKLTLLIQGLLIMSFCLIIIIKMSYFGIAWTVVFLTFYAVSPALCLLSCVLMIFCHYYDKSKERKYLEKHKPLSTSHSSFVEKSSSHHSGLSASAGFKGSTTSTQGFKGKKKDPYSLYLVERSASESHLSIKANPNIIDNPLKKSKSGNCVNTVVKLKVPSNYNLAIHKTMDREADFLTQEQEEQMRRKKTRNTQLTLTVVIISIFVIVAIIPLSVCISKLSQEEAVDVTYSKSLRSYLALVTMLTMQVIHSIKFYIYCVSSSVFRRHLCALFTCTQKDLAEEETPSLEHPAV